MLGSFDSLQLVENIREARQTWARSLPRSHFLVTSPPFDTSNVSVVPPACRQLFVDKVSRDVVYDCGVDALVVFPALCTNDFLRYSHQWYVHGPRHSCSCRFFAALEMATRWILSDARYGGVRWLFDTDDDVYLHLGRARHMLRTLGFNASVAECASTGDGRHTFDMWHHPDADAENVTELVRRHVNGVLGSQRLMSRALLAALQPLLVARHWVELNRSYRRDSGALGNDEALTVPLASVAGGVRDRNALDNHARWDQFVPEKNHNMTPFWHKIKAVPDDGFNYTFRHVHAAVHGDDAARETPYSVQPPRLDVNGLLVLDLSGAVGQPPLPRVTVNAAAPFVSFLGVERAMRADGLAMRARDTYGARSLAQLSAPLAVRDLFAAAERRAFVAIHAGTAHAVPGRIAFVPASVAAYARAALEAPRLASHSTLVGAAADATVAAALGAILRFNPQPLRVVTCGHWTARLAALLWLNGVHVRELCVSSTMHCASAPFVSIDEDCPALNFSYEERIKIS